MFKITETSCSIKRTFFTLDFLIDGNKKHTIIALGDRSICSANWQPKT